MKILSCNKGGDWRAGTIVVYPWLALSHYWVRIRANFFLCLVPGRGGSFRGKGGGRKRLINSILFAEKNARITKSPGWATRKLGKKGDRGLLGKEGREGKKKHLPIVIWIFILRRGTTESSLSLLQFAQMYDDYTFALVRIGHHRSPSFCWVIIRKNDEKGGGQSTPLRNWNIVYNKYISLIMIT